MGQSDTLNAIFDAERALRAHEAELLSRKDKALAEVLGRAVDQALALDDREEAGLRLFRLADLCAQVGGPLMADALIRILNADDPHARNEAGEALLDFAYDRYAEVARAIERALDQTMAGPAMLELPFLLAEVGEPSALKLIRRFADHPDPDVVAAAIEAFAQLGDPAAIETLEQLTEDDREVTLEDDSDESITSTIGELAEEAIHSLSASASD
jgi:HEAT repeat protein